MQKKLKTSRNPIRSSRQYYLCLYLALLVLSALSCKKSELPESSKEVKTAFDVKEKLKAAGFDISEGFSKTEDGYIVEYDIFLTENDIRNLSDSSRVKIPLNLNVGASGARVAGSKISSLKATQNNPTSHYTSEQLVYLYSGSSTPYRNIQIYLDPSFGTYLQSALDVAIARYNNVGLLLNFSRTYNPGSANISIIPVSSQSYLMSSGFPTGVGSPYDKIRVNTDYYNSSSNRADAASTFAHEIGHAIGFRHTDFMNRAFSCNGDNSNEGSGSSGAIWIPGTSSQPTAGSWMLACSNNYDRPFIPQDVLALRWLYGARKNIYVKEVMTVISNDSSYDWINDHELITFGIVAEFYQDQAKTIPYTTSDYFILNTNVGSEEVYNPSPFIVPDGVTSYDLGVYVRDKYYTGGTLVQDNSSGFRVLNFSGYFGPIYPFN